MDFKAPPAVLDALQKRLNHGVFGYETVPDGLLSALTGWLREHHGWQVDESHVLRAPNILNALAVAASLFTKDGDGVIVQPPVFFDFFDILRENSRPWSQIRWCWTMADTSSISPILRKGPPIRAQR